MNDKRGSAKVDRLDAAIDHVAARLVAVDDDPDLALRIASALPDRSSRFGWLIPQLAAFSAIAIAAVVWSLAEQPASVAVLPSTDMEALSAFPPATVREPGTALRTTPLERMEPVEPVELLEPSAVDFERALPALELSAIGLEALATAEPLALSPIEIGELPLTAETIAPDKFE
jgi:hypothetical protein